MIGRSPGLRRVHLGHRGGGQRGHVEAAEHVADLRAELVFDQLHGEFRVERRHPILQ
jgi:hypothetical protein